jgi:hypothetical protein
MTKRKKYEYLSIPCESPIVGEVVFAVGESYFCKDDRIFCGCGNDLFVFHKMISGGKKERMVEVYKCIKCKKTFKYYSFYEEPKLEADS